MLAGEWLPIENREEKTRDRSGAGERRMPGKRKENATMNYRLLGNSGLRVSELSLGTMTFGEETPGRRSL